MEANIVKEAKNVEQKYHNGGSLETLLLYEISLLYIRNRVSNAVHSAERNYSKTNLAQNDRNPCKIWKNIIEIL